MELVIFDNQDSFTYNLVESFRKIGVKNVHLESSTDFDLAKLDRYDRIVLGPGPGLPMDHPVLFDMLGRLNADQSVLGICLGHEAIAMHYGGEIHQEKQVFHGDQAQVFWENAPSFLSHKIPTGFPGALYHSWVLTEESLPKDIVITARSERDLVMGIRHKTLPLFGFQFHPESYISKFGLQLIYNWYHHSLD